MAQKRMFDVELTKREDFMDLPVSTIGAYFLLGMNADDEGFISPKIIMRVYGVKEDDIKLLAAKGFVIPFKTGVVVITHWNQNNWLDKRRIKPTLYNKEKAMIGDTDDRMYTLSNGLAIASPEEKRTAEQRAEEQRLLTERFDRFWSLYPRKVGKAVCVKWWERKKPDEELTLKMLSSVEKYIQTDQWKRGIIPHPSTYLNQQRWDDEIGTLPQAQGTFKSYA